MQKLKTVFTLLFLVCLTALMVYLPIIINAQSTSKLTSESTVYTRKSNEITAKQVARLYVSGAMSSGIVLSSTETPISSETRDTTKLLIDSLFSENQIAKSYVSKMIEGEIIYYYKESLLIILENSPIALNFINIGFRYENTMLEITFEEKTKTLIGFIVSFSDIVEGPTESIMQTLCNYYENQLSLKKGEYYFAKDRLSIGIWYKTKYEEDIIY